MVWDRDECNFCHVQMLALMQFRKYVFFNKKEDTWFKIQKVVTYCYSRTFCRCLIGSIQRRDFPIATTCHKWINGVRWCWGDEVWTVFWPTWGPWLIGHCWSVISSFSWRGFSCALCHGLNRLGQNCPPRFFIL